MSAGMTVRAKNPVHKKSVRVTPGLSKRVPRRTDTDTGHIPLHREHATSDVLQSSAGGRVGLVGDSATFIVVDKRIAVRCLQSKYD